MLRKGDRVRRNRREGTVGLVGTLVCFVRWDDYPSVSTVTAIRHLEKVEPERECPELAAC